MEGVTVRVHDLVSGGGEERAVYEWKDHVDLHVVCFQLQARDAVLHRLDCRGQPTDRESLVSSYRSSAASRS